MRRIASYALLALLLALTLVGCGPTSCTKDGDGTGGGKKDATNVEVTLSVGESAEFDYAGETHTAELISVTGSSVTVVISSSPTTYQLTEGLSTEADLDDDSLPETTLEVSAVSDKGATLTVNAIVTPVWDETDFTTAGGLAPYDVRGYSYVDPSLVVLDDGTYLLFYSSGSAHQGNWEHYRPDGTQILSPQLGAGRTAWTGGGVSEQEDPMDIIRVGDSLITTVRSNGDTYIGNYDLDADVGDLTLDARSGAFGFLSPWEDAMPLATNGEDIWYATHEKPSSPSPSARPGVAVMGIAPGRPAMRVGSQAVTQPPDGMVDVAPDLDYDATTGMLAIPYVRFTIATNQFELRFAVVDAETLELVHDVLIAEDAEFDKAAPGGMGVLAEDGEALLYWETAAPENQRISMVDLRTGTVRDTYSSNDDNGIDGLTNEARDLELVRLPDGPAILFLHRTAAPEGTSGSKSAVQRFVLQPIDENGPTGERTILNGGQPVFADVTFDLASLRANPIKAICGSPCLLMGTIVNRGSRPAEKVVLEVAVSGKSVGTLDVGTIKPGGTNTFAKVWDVPAELTDEQVTVTYTLTTKSEQYTADNDVTEKTILVRQKGLVQGRVTNASGVVDPGWWAGGLEGVEVSFGGKTVLTDANGVFAIEEVEFGTGTLTATKEGFNPASLEIETKRTSPIASAGIRMDDHGTLRLHVVDEDTGEALSGVQVFLMGYERTDKTDAGGDVTYAIPKGTYRFAFKKSGYHAIAPIEYTVLLGQDTAETIRMKEAVTADLSGRVVDKYGTGVAGASVTIEDAKGEVAAQLTCDANGDFSVLELSTKPSGSYVIVATGNTITVEEPISLSGGEVASVMVELIPGRGELAQRSATEGYTSWMLKAAWPGFMDVGGQSIYVWYGNYAMDVGAQYWDGSRELNRVEVTAWGGTYETHVTKGEIEFDVSGDDLTGGAGKKLPEGIAETTDAASSSWWKTAAKTGYSYYKKYTDPINLAKEIYTGVKDVREAWSGEGDDWIVMGQGPELLTWKESLSDFNVRPSWDAEHPLDSAMSLKAAIPTSFAIPIVIGGSSVQETAVRVDGIDVVDKKTGEVYATDRDVWYSYDSLAGDGSAFRSFEIEHTGVYAEDVRIFVWVTVQKYWLGAPGGTCFDQREKQVIVFDPGSGGMKAFIAPGDLYKDPSRWTTEDIARLTED